MKHGCGTRGATPTFDAAGRGDARGMPLPACLAESCRVVPCGFHFFFSRLASTGVNMAPTRADLRGIGPTRAISAKTAETADSGQNSKKKKKKVQNTSFELITKPYFSPLHTNTKLKLSTFPHTSVSHSSLCSVCSLPPFRLPCGCETLSNSTLTQFTHFNSFFL